MAAVQGNGTCTLCGNDLAGCHNPCTECRGGGPETPLTSVISLGPWSGALREWVSMLKYGGDARLAQYPAELLVRLVKANWPGLPLVPVPPRFSRIFHEGFDPVNAVARRMAERGIVVEHLLRRRGNQSQKTLSRAERLRHENLKYQLRMTACEVKGPKILFDDVSTTGSTLRVCADILRRAGAGEVHGLVICRD